MDQTKPLLDESSHTTILFSEVLSKNKLVLLQICNGSMWYKDYRATPPNVTKYKNV